MPRKGDKQPPKQVGNLGDPHGMAVMLEKFLEWMQVTNYSPRTVENRKLYLSYFIIWAEERGLTRPTEITKPILERYQRFLYHHRKTDGNPLSFRSQSSRLVPVRAWFKWLARNNHILYNPASELELPRFRTSPPQARSDDPRKRNRPRRPQHHRSPGHPRSSRSSRPCTPPASVAWKWWG